MAAMGFRLQTFTGTPGSLSVHTKTSSAFSKSVPFRCKKVLLRIRAGENVDVEDVEQSTKNADVEQSSLDEQIQNDIMVDSRREQERFIVRDLGKYQCRSCGYVYDQTVGDPAYPVAPGVDFSQLPPDWRCSTCGAAKSYFNSISVEVAGFAENQTYGLGTNSMTSGQKSLLIYGSLVFFFILFLSGYFLQ